MVSFSPDGSVGGPAAVDGQRGAGDLRGGVGAQERGQGGDLLDRRDVLRGLRRQQHAAPDRLLADAAGGGGLGDLPFDQRGQHLRQAGRIGGDPVFDAFEPASRTGRRPRAWP
jgi:hypothetical protein